MPRAALPDLHPLEPRADALGVGLLFVGAFALYTLVFHALQALRIEFVRVA